MFNKYISVNIPCEGGLKRLTAKYNNKNINSLEKIKKVKYIDKFKKVNLNCKHIILIPAEKLYLGSHNFKKNNFKDTQVSETELVEKYNKDNIDLKNDYYYDAIKFSDPENSENLKLKILAAEKNYIDKLTEKLDKYPNNYMVTALPTAIYSLSRKFINKNSYIFYYKIGSNYTILVNYKNTLDSIRSSIKENFIECELEKTKKYYLNSKKLNLPVLKGKADIFKVKELKNICEEDFAFLASLFWGVSRC